MHKLSLLLAFALLCHVALGFRIKRQSQDNGEDLEDRYGWNRPGRFPNQGQFALQRGFNTQGGWGYPQNQLTNDQWGYPDLQYPTNFPWQFPTQTQRIDQFPGPQFPGQPFPGPFFPGPFPGVNPGQNPVPNPGQGQNPVQPPNPTQPTTATPTSGSTTQSAALQDCIRTCLVTPEYNPVCGTDNVTYDNPGRLLCAQSCGVSVTQLRASRCPNATVAPVAK